MQKQAETGRNASFQIKKHMFMAEFDGTAAAGGFFSSELLFRCFKVNVMQLLMAVVGEKGRAMP